MRCIAVINQKGGVGKTTTAVNLSAALAERGRRVLLVDLDPQAHASLHLGVSVDDGGGSIYDVLLSGETDACRKVRENLWLLPSHIDLAAAEMELVGQPQREGRLRAWLAANAGQYDHTIIDCPPSLGVLTLNALVAAREVLLPLQAHFLALHGLSQLLRTLQLVAARHNPELRLCGIAFCMLEPATRLGAEVVNDVRQFLTQGRGTGTLWADARVFNTAIRKNIRLAEAPSHGKSIFEYAPQCHGAGDYADLAQELLQQGTASARAA